MAGQLIGSTVAGKYRLDTLLRSSESGSVYRGRHVFMDRPVMIKVLRPDTAAETHDDTSFNAEARSAALIKNDHILPATDFGVDENGSRYVIYDAFDGASLKDLIDKEAPFSIGRATAITTQIGRALDAAHGAEFAHGSLTPSSVLAGGSIGSPDVRIFGLRPKRSLLKDDGLVMSGDVSYLAPERLSRTASADHRADVYSLGTILYQMLAGRVPFTGETQTDVALLHADEAVPDIKTLRPDVPPALEAAVVKALAKDPDERFASAGEFADAIEAATAPEKSTFQSTWRTAAIVITGVAALAAGMIFMTQSRRTEPITQLQSDANGQPVQPIAPATGTEEMNLMSMQAAMPAEMSNAQAMPNPPGTIPGGDGYNPWASGGYPPSGAPLPGSIPPDVAIPPPGKVVTVDPNSPSVFMPNESGVILVPVPRDNDAAPGDDKGAKSAANANTGRPPATVPNKAPANTAKPAKPAETAPAKDAKPAPKPATPAKPADKPGPPPAL